MGCDVVRSGAGERAAESLPLEQPGNEHREVKADMCDPAVDYLDRLRSQMSRVPRFRTKSNEPSTRLATPENETFGA